MLHLVPYLRIAFIINLLKNSLFNVKFIDFQLKGTWIDIPKLRGLEKHINK